MHIKLIFYVGNDATWIYNPDRAFWKHINISHKLYLNAFSFDKLSLQFYISAKLEYSTLVT